MQQHPVFILSDPRGNLEQRENDCFGLRIGQRSTLQTQFAQLLVQDIRCSGQQQTGEVDQL